MEVITDVFRFVVGGGIILAVLYSSYRRAFPKQVPSSKNDIVKPSDNEEKPTTEYLGSGTNFPASFYGDVPDRVPLAQAELISDIPPVFKGEELKTAEQYLLEGYTVDHLNAFNRERKLVFVGYFRKEGYKEGYAYYFFECLSCKKFSVSRTVGYDNRVVCCWCSYNMYPDDFNS